ncbi:MAG: hypothetical protein HRT95_10680 [Moritella sp.]|uniref:HEPN/Toprim-associated domain-containing protein n=1 Tax=Moritella sp. TaxID=78556 RepID=UPI001D6D4D94|nr:HEPN/Toprim-associated domain-containing protein [Moritella sp.]NQZ50614.1 hypothetical protein [Moritella sp.]
MGSYADITINGYELESWKNTYHEWYFTKADRVRNIVNEEDTYASENFIGYRSNVATIRRRIQLAGYDLKSVELDFNETRALWIKNMREMLSIHQDDAESKFDSLNFKVSSQLEVVQNASFKEWIAAMPRALALGNSYYEQAFNYQSVYIDNEPLLSLMLSPLYGVYDENLFFSGPVFPCMDMNSYAVILLEVADEDGLCELDINDLVNGGWVDDFEDMAQTQAGETLFHENFMKSLNELSTLNGSMKNETLQKMSFASVITTMEAYLSDTMKKQVFNRHAIKRRFVKHYNLFDKNVKNIKPSEIFEFMDKLDHLLSCEMDKISFHNIETITGLFQNILLCNFPTDKISELSTAVDIRHDIVHRNGKSTDGSIVIVSQQDVVNLLELVQYIIKHIDLQIIDGRLDDSIIE